MQREISRQFVPARRQPAEDRRSLVRAAEADEQMQIDELQQLRQAQRRLRAAQAQP